MGTNYFNTTLGLSMLPDGNFSVRTIRDDAATSFIRSGVNNVANPNHANTLDAISRRLTSLGLGGVDVRAAKGGRIRLALGDSCLVAEISGVPRETREFTDEEIAAATFTFRLVEVVEAERRMETVEHGISCCCPSCGPSGRLQPPNQ